jgi:hypothetical protein
VKDNTGLVFELVGAAKIVPVCVTGEDNVEKARVEVVSDIAASRCKYKMDISNKEIQLDREAGMLLHVAVAKIPSSHHIEPPLKK